MSKNSEVRETIQPASVEMDSSGRVYSAEFDDLYYQMPGGAKESLHVYCEGNALIDRFKLLDPDKPGVFIIGEVGFGTGLNFLNVMHLWSMHAPSCWRLHFLSAEKHPLTKKDLVKILTFCDALRDCKNKLIECYPILLPGIHRMHFKQISLSLLLGDAYEMFSGLLPTNHLALGKNIKHYGVDAWFLDGFSPSKNASPWQLRLFKVIAALSKHGTTLSTFSVAKRVKDNLQRVGFKINKNKGFGQKRDMLKAVYQGKKELGKLILQRASSYTTPWHHAVKKIPSSHRIAVIGAGMAGCGIAYQLAIRGYHVSIIEKEADVALGASGNATGILDIKPSPFHSPLNDFSLESFLYAVQFYKSLGITSNHGLLRLLVNDKEKKYQSSLNDFVTSYPELARFVSIDEVRELAGIELPYPGLYLAGAGLLSPQSLCKRLIDHKNIRLIPCAEIETITRKENAWWVNDSHYQQVVIASSVASTDLLQSADIPLTAFPGLIKYYRENTLSASLKLPLSGDNYFSPSVDGYHTVGELDEHIQLFDLNTSDIAGTRYSIRAKTSDYLPLIGPIPIDTTMKKQFSLFSKDANYFFPEEGVYQEGIFILSGFGSHGLTTMPLASELLACLIHHEPLPLNTACVRHLSPARFLIRHLKKNN